MKRYELNNHISIPNNAKKYLKYLQLFTNHFKPVTASTLKMIKNLIPDLIMNTLNINKFRIHHQYCQEGRY